MSTFYSWILPLPETRVEDLEILEANQLTYEFRQEVQYRQDFADYCQWYRDCAQQHQQELAAMRTEINILGWFRRDRHSHS